MKSKAFVALILVVGLILMTLNIPISKSNIFFDPEPDLDCDGDLYWIEVEPGSTVTGTLTVENIGDAGSLLDWEITDWPDWGVNWTFTPESGIDLTPECGPLIVEVEFTAPFEELTDFPGCVKVVNQENSSDYGEVPIQLPTGPYSRIPKPYKGIYLNDKKILPFIVPLILGHVTIEISACCLIDEVEFYIDGELQYTDTTQPFGWIWDEPAFFKHTIETIAINNSEDIHSHKGITVWKFF